MRVLVVCNAGMSSSILVKKMKDYAASQGEELMIKGGRCCVQHLPQQLQKRGWQRSYT